MPKEESIFEGQADSPNILDAVNNQDQAVPQEIDELKKIIKSLVIENGGKQTEDGKVIASDSILRKVAGEVGIYHQTLNKFIADEDITKGVIEKLSYNCQAVTIEPRHYIQSSIDLTNLMISKDNDVKIIHHIYPTADGISKYKENILTAIKEINKHWSDCKKSSSDSNITSQLELQSTLEESEIISKFKEKNILIYGATLPMYMKNLIHKDSREDMKDAGLILYILIFVGFKEDDMPKDGFKLLPNFDRAEK
jgi:hypothetical protein